MVRAWAEKNVVPFHDQWEKDGIVPREVWLSGGEQGLLGMDVEEKFGGGGVRDGTRYEPFGEEILLAGRLLLGVARRRPRFQMFCFRFRHRRLRGTLGVDERSTLHDDLVLGLRELAGSAVELRALFFQSRPNLVVVELHEDVSFRDLTVQSENVSLDPSGDETHDRMGLVADFETGSIGDLVERDAREEEPTEP